jgi:hypothetical protein
LAVSILAVVNSAVVRNPSTGKGTEARRAVCVLALFLEVIAGFRHELF